MFNKYIDFPVFLSSFLIGLLFIYFKEDEKKIVEIKPTPENTHKYIYKNIAGECFKYNAKQVSCNT